MRWLILKWGVWVSGSGAQRLRGPGSQREPLRECRGICGCARRAHQPRSKEETKLKETLKIDHRNSFLLSIPRGTFPGIRMVDVALKGPEGLFHTR